MNLEVCLRYYESRYYNKTQADNIKFVNRFPNYCRVRTIAISNELDTSPFLK